MAEFTNEIKSRGMSRAELGAPRLNEDQLKALDNWREQLAKDPASRPDPGEGKIYQDTYGYVWSGLKTVYRQTPKTSMNLSNMKFQDHLDKLADQIVKQEKLGERSAESLSKGFDRVTGDLTVAKLLPRAEEALRNQPQQPALQVQAERKNIAERKTVFEPKQAGGGFQVGS